MSNSIWNRVTRGLSARMLRCTLWVRGERSGAARSACAATLQAGQGSGKAACRRTQGAKRRRAEEWNETRAGGCGSEPLLSVYLRRRACGLPQPAAKGRRIVACVVCA